MKHNDKFISRKLEERSYLAFDFPAQNGNETTYLPFLENISLSENQESSLTEHNPIGRNSSIFSYGGARSRTFRLEFNMTLLHIMELLSKDGIATRFKKAIYGRKVPQFGFSLYLAGVPSENLPNFDVVNDINTSKIHRSYYFDLTETERKKSAAYSGNGLRTIGRSVVGTNFVQTEFPTKTASDEAINLMLYWTNLVRSSTKNNSISTSYGPPIVRLNHGTMYNNIPCVCENYGVEIINDAGYDLESMTPKQIKITMELREQRTGNFKKYEKFKKIAGDNNTGWESVLNSNNMDPFNGLIQR